jgi:stearoyl-CoA desaturase (delta-9 desaturase)
VHVVVISLFSAVTHRYFCHKAFDANPFVMWLLATVPVAYGYSTPIQWASMHSAHHAYADTDRDPHIKGWAGLFTAAYRTPPAKFVLASKWFRDRKHQWVYDNALILIAGFQLSWLAVSVDAFLWLGLVPIFTLNFCNGLHRVLSHDGNTVKNRWYLEYAFPMGGEWIHDEHHDNARKIKFSNHWYELDTGSFFVKLLQKRSAQ